MCWKLLFIATWTEALSLFLAQETPAPANPITVMYGWAQLISTLTDRALWLFFLGLILWIAWWIDRRKDRQLDEYRKWERANAERLVKTLEDNSQCMENLKEEMKDLRGTMERVDRRLDR